MMPGCPRNWQLILCLARYLAYFHMLEHACLNSEQHVPHQWQSQRRWHRKALRCLSARASGGTPGEAICNALPSSFAGTLECWLTAELYPIVISSLTLHSLHGLLLNYPFFLGKNGGYCSLGRGSKRPWPNKEAALPLWSKVTCFSPSALSRRIWTCTSLTRCSLVWGVVLHIFNKDTSVSNYWTDSIHLWGQQSRHTQTNTLKHTVWAHNIQQYSNNYLSQSHQLLFFLTSLQ